MPKTSYADVNLEVDPAEPQRAPIPAKPDRDTPFRILVLGDFSGRASRGIATKGHRKPVPIDRDNFEDVLESLNVQVRLTMQGGAAIEASIRELDDFHPDVLFQKLPLFGKLRDLRDRLDDPSTFARAARELGIAATAPSPKPAAAKAAPPPARVTESILGGSLLDQAMEVTESRSEGVAPARSSDPIAQFVRSIVEPHLAPKVDPKKGEVIQMVDMATGAAMQAILHHPLYQELEANWRALYLLIRELETGTNLKVYLLDISKEELEEDIGASEDLKTTAMYRTLVEQTVRTPGAHPWALLVGANTFGPSVPDLNLLGRMGLLARMSGAPFVACASSRLIGCDSIAKTPYPEDWDQKDSKEGWELIRSLPEARYLGLVLPRFLLRLPYGKSGEQTERFAFEEMTSPPKHEDYLWGNSAFLCALLLGQAFAESGWGFDEGELLNIHNLPAHVYKKDGEAMMTPPAEVFLTQSAMEKIHECGIMTLMSYANSDKVRLAGFRSVANPAAALAGRWG